MMFVAMTVLMLTMWAALSEARPAFPAYHQVRMFGLEREFEPVHSAGSGQPEVAGVGTLPLAAGHVTAALDNGPATPLGTNQSGHGPAHGPDHSVHHPASGEGAQGSSPNASTQPARPQISAQEVHFALAFTRVVSILMRSNPHRHYSLSDLEWLVLPPIMTGQFAILDAQVNGQVMPVALALWARVSAEVDQRLSDPTLPSIRLKPDEWRSGEILWLIDAVGDGNSIPKLLQRLNEGPFAGKNAKIRQVREDGTASVALPSYALHDLRITDAYRDHANG